MVVVSDRIYRFLKFISQWITMTLLLIILLGDSNGFIHHKPPPSRRRRNRASESPTITNTSVSTIQHENETIDFYITCAAIAGGLVSLGINLGPKLSTMLLIYILLRVNGYDIINPIIYTPGNKLGNGRNNSFTRRLMDQFGPFLRYINARS